MENETLLELDIDNLLTESPTIDDVLKPILGFNWQSILTYGINDGV